MSGILTIFLFCFMFINISEASHTNKLPSAAIVVGSVYCNTCFQEDFSKNSHFISGATVAVECRDENSVPSFHQKVKTDEFGKFQVRLPFSVDRHLKRIGNCSVELLKSSEPSCAVASTETSSSLSLKSRKQGIRIFSAGFLSFRPQHQQNLCNYQKPSVQNFKSFNSRKFSSGKEKPATENFKNGKDLTGLGTKQPDSFFPPIFPPNPFQPPPFFPPNPFQPPPLLPPNPFQPPPIIPNPFQPPPLLPPNPFQPPPIIPNPFQPPPFFPPLQPPNPLHPPPSPLFPFPPIPGLTPPSPPPPIFPFPPLPPFIFPPSPPRIPGIPPASPSSSTSGNVSP